MKQSNVLGLIQRERQYQKAKWGNDKCQSLEGYLLILQKEINEATEGWIKNAPGRDSPHHEILQVAAVAVAALEQHLTDDDFEDIANLCRGA